MCHSLPTSGTFTIKVDDANDAPHFYIPPPPIGDSATSLRCRHLLLGYDLCLSARKNVEFGQNIGGVVNKVVDIMPPALKERTGAIIQKTVSNIKSLATKVKSQDLNAAVETIVADAIILPAEKTARANTPITATAGGESVIRRDITD